MSKLYSERTHFTVRMVENMAKMKIAVLFGGASSEHEVSLVSAYSVLTNIPNDKYDVMCIGITKKGHWLCYPGEYEDIRTGEWENNPDNCTAVITPLLTVSGLITAVQSARELSSSARTTSATYAALTRCSRCCTEDSARTAPCRRCAHSRGFPA